MPVASLPGKYGIGSFGKESYAFVDMLHEAGQSYWQILPLGPTSYGDSPYQSFSTFAGNPYFIDLEELISEGFLEEKQVDKCDCGGSEEYIDYEKMYRARFGILRKAYDNRENAKDSKAILKDFEDFKERPENDWLRDYSLFMALKNANSGRAWNTWDEGVRLRKKEALDAAFEKYKDEVEFYSFLQFLFFSVSSSFGFFLFFKSVIVGEEIQLYRGFLRDPVLREQITGDDIDPPNKQVRIDDPVIQIQHDCRNTPGRAGPAVNAAGSVSMFGVRPAIRVRLNYAFIRFSGRSYEKTICTCRNQAGPVIADGQSDFFCYDTFTDQVHDQYFRHLTDDEFCLFSIIWF